VFSYNGFIFAGQSLTGRGQRNLDRLQVPRMCSLSLLGIISYENKKFLHTTDRRAYDDDVFYLFLQNKKIGLRHIPFGSSP